MGFIHCRNSKCIGYWEDSCTLNLEGKVVAIDEGGECEDFASGKSKYYDDDGFADDMTDEEICNVLDTFLPKVEVADGD